MQLCPFVNSFDKGDFMHLNKVLMQINQPSPHKLTFVETFHGKFFSMTKGPFYLVVQFHKRDLYGPLIAEPHSSVGSIQELRTGGPWFNLWARPIFFPRIDHCHWDRINSSFTAVHCFDNGYVGKEPVACAEYWFNPLPDDKF